MSDPRRVAIVGAGLLGMTLAWRLAKLGYKVRLCEADNQCGGLAQAWKIDDLIWDRHYHVTLLSDQELRGLLSELGIENEILWKEARSGFFGGGELRSLAGPIDYLRLPTMRLIAKLRLAFSLVYASRVRNWRYLETISAEKWLSRLSGAEAWLNLWTPLLRAKVGDNYRNVSAAFIWAIIARLVKARRMGYRNDLFGYLPGGYARTLSVFEEALRQAGVEISTGDRVESVSRKQPDELPGSESSRRETIELSFSSGRREFFEQVVVTLAPPLAMGIVPGLTEAETASWMKIKYQGLVCPTLVLRRPLGGYYLTYITDQRVAFTSVIEMSALAERSQFGGRTLVYLPCYADPCSPLFDSTEDEIRTKFVAGLKIIFPDFQESDILAWKLSRVRHVFAISTLNYSSGVPGFATSVPGVFLVNSSQIVNGTLNVNESVQLANRAVSEIAAEVVEEVR